MRDRVTEIRTVIEALGLPGFGAYLKNDDPLYRKLLVTMFDCQDWDEGGRVHNWRNHVPQEIKQLWPRLSDEAKAVALFMAEEAASREEWD